MLYGCLPGPLSVPPGSPPPLFCAGSSWPLPAPSALPGSTALAPPFRPLLGASSNTKVSGYSLSKAAAAHACNLLDVCAQA